MKRNEALALFGALFFVHALLFLRGLPLPHHDSFFFTEPALHLSRSGRLIGPSAEYCDFTYGLYFGPYPPLHFLVLAGWVRLFGYSPASHLALTHLVHIVYLALVWTLARVRFGGSRLTATLLLISCFPLFNHGRPDLLASTFAVAAFVALPKPGAGGFPWLTSVLLALTLVTSPALGIGAVTAVSAFVALGAGRLTLDAAKRAVLIGGAGVTGALSLWALVITWQDAWWIAVPQYRVNVAVRGRQLNGLPAAFELVSPYFFAFTYLPLLFAAILPAAVALFRKRDENRHPLLPLASAAYLIGLIPLLLTNRLQLFYQHNFALAARLPLHTTLLESRGRYRIFGFFAIAAFTLSHFFIAKETYVYALKGDLREERLDPGVVASSRVLAVDSNNAHAHFGQFDGVLLDYNIVKFNQWREFFEHTPPEVRARLPPRLRAGEPIVPDTIVITTRGHLQMGSPNPDVYEKISGPPLTPIDFFGLPLRQAATPLALHVYRLRPSVPIPDAL